jgi:hypothetical protein
MTTIHVSALPYSTLGRTHATDKSANLGHRRGSIVYARGPANTHSTPKADLTIRDAQTDVSKHERYSLRFP